MTTKAAAAPAAIEEAWQGLVCPDCAARIDQTPEELACSRCGHKWPVVDGVPHFVSDFPYWGEVPQESMRQINAAAERGSWKSPLVESADPVVRRAAEMILNLDRANWQWLIDLPPGSRALDLGAGMGTNSHALGMRCREVVALEPVLERIRFMKQRFAQEGLSNVKPLRSSLWVLPFARESFDLVAMNGVLEWVPLGQPGNPRDAQLRALKNAFNLLRAGGHFYLGIENRMCLGYLIGYPDPHCGLPYVTAMPRPMAHWYARRKGHKDGYRNYLYSSRGYRKLLQQAGFSSVECFVALPSYNHPRFLIPIEGDLFSYYARNFTPEPGNFLRKVLREVLLRLDLMKHCEYSFVLLARK
jgi:SAM-dependent methyltransferase